MPIHFQVGKLPDKIIIETIEAIEAALGAESKNFLGGEVNFNDGIRKLKAKNVATYILTEANIRTKGGSFNVKIHRDPSKQNFVYFDDIIITPRGNPPPSADDLLRLEDVIRSKIRMPSLKAPANSEVKWLACLRGRCRLSPACMKSCWLTP